MLELAAKRTADAALRGDPQALHRLHAAVTLPGLQMHLDASAAVLAEALGAHALTLGRDVFFGAGRFAPHTQAGQQLIAHELAHVAQQAGGAPRQIQREVAGGSPFAHETDEERARRQRLLTSIDAARDNLLRLLSTRGLIDGVEVATEHRGAQGVQYHPGSPSALFETYAERDRRIRRIVRALITMAAYYRRNPIPASFGPPVPAPAGAGGYASSPVRYRHRGMVTESTFSGGTAAWADLQAAYQRYQAAQGRLGDEFVVDWLFLEPSIQVRPGAARGAPRFGRGIALGLYMVVPDIEREPLHYYRLSGFRRDPPGSTIVEIWSDAFGCFYWYRGRRIDVPDPASSR